MKDIKSSRILKIISYIAVPILTLILIINVISVSFALEYEEDMNGYTDYFNTQKYGEKCLRTIYQSTATIAEQMKQVEIKNKAVVQQIEVSDNDITLQRVEDNGIYYTLGSYNLDLVIVTKEGKIYTNLDKTVKTDTLEKLKQTILEKKRTWKYESGTITTNIEKLKYENIAYNTMYEYIEDNVEQVYASIRDENSRSFYLDKTLYELVAKTHKNAPLVITITGILLLAACSYIIISIGHKKGEEGIYSNGLDRIPLEIIIVVSGIILTLEACLFEIFVNMNSRFIDIGIPMIILWGFAVYITLAITGVTVIRRIKSKIFFKNTICYKILRFLKISITHLIKDMFTNINRTVKLAIIVGGFTLISIILFLYAMDSFLFFLILLIFWYFAFRKLVQEANKAYEVRDKIRNIYNGDIEKPLEEEKFSGELKQIVHELNDISGGLSNAIEQGLKSERLKTELITNVSHDIKTPLTSIINYVDLLKKEDIQDEKIQEYLQVLENKSQRLKKLTEDLVEASKASSGNIKLNMEKLNVKELLKQVRGEFEDRFEEKGLQVIEGFPNEDIYILADSKYMYRVMENIYTNIVKYALENSRIYIDITKEESSIQIETKNISKDKLNITVDELMQRFVRGDSARTTEGSGLGISIAKSLTELQNGEFSIYLDGDLFKVILRFKVIEE